MRNNQGSHTHLYFHQCKKCQHSNSEHDLRNHDGNIQQIADSLPSSEFKTIHTYGTQCPKNHGKQGADSRYDQRVEKRLHQLDIFKHPSIPLECKTLKGHIQLRCIKGKYNDHSDRQI